jgi:hypothetical protein
MRSKFGHWWMNSRYSSVEQNPHHPLDAGAVVPGAVEQHDLAGRRQMLDIALEIPLRTLGIAGFFQRDHACAARVQVLHEALDRAALPRRIPSFEQDHHALAGLLHPGLPFQQFDLQPALLAFVPRTRHAAARRCIGLVSPIFGNSGLADADVSTEFLFGHDGSSNGKPHCPAPGP